MIGIKMENGKSRYPIVFYTFILLFFIYLVPHVASNSSLVLNATIISRVNSSAVLMLNVQ